MEYSIVRVEKENYPLFDDMIFFRINNRERTLEEQAESRDYGANFTELADKKFACLRCKSRQ